MSEDAKTEPKEDPTAPPGDLIKSYCPFVGDVPLSAYAEPFPAQPDDGLTDEEIQAKKHALRRKIHNKTFSPAIPLADFCLIAQDRWAQEGELTCNDSACLLL
jgi:hypothetical protein